MTDPAITTGEAQPFAGWSLSAVWTQPGAPLSTITYVDDFTLSQPGDSTALVSVHGRLTSLYVTMWATDPFGTKQLSVGPAPIMAHDPIDGRRDGFIAGYTQFGVDHGLSANSGTVFLNNEPDGGFTDTLWTGPVLAVSIPGQGAAG